VVGGVVVTAAIVLMFVLPRSRSRRAQAAIPAAPVPDRASESSRGTGRALASPVTRPGMSAPEASAGPRRRLDAVSRARMLEALAVARSRRGPPAADPVAGGDGASEAATAGSLDKDYIRGRVRELIPLLSECYVAALEDAPAIVGKLVVELTIGGEPEVGGLVEASEVIADESTIVHAGMLECVRETMYAAQFDPPEQGGTVVVRYPFAFAPSADAP
jgi:hypothetical protein